MDCCPTHPYYISPTSSVYTVKKQTNRFLIKTGVKQRYLNSLLMIFNSYSAVEIFFSRALMYVCQLRGNKAI